MSAKLQVRDLGRMDYKPCWDLQESIFQDMVQAKIARRNAGLLREEALFPSCLVAALWWASVCLDLGKSGEASNVVASPERLEELGVQYFPINRRDITYHGPGQLVVTRCWIWTNFSRTSTNTR